MRVLPGVELIFACVVGVCCSSFVLLLPHTGIGPTCLLCVCGCLGVLRERERERASDVVTVGASC